jgi:hypothetical protein
MTSLKIRILNKVTLDKVTEECLKCLQLDNVENDSEEDTDKSCHL